MTNKPALDVARQPDEIAIVSAMLNPAEWFPFLKKHSNPRFGFNARMQGKPRWIKKFCRISKSGC
jgi:hypothetical protein